MKNIVDFFKYNIPTVRDIINIDNSDKDINVVRFRFDSIKNNGIYTVLAYPKKAGIYPGILVLHGGMQNADIVANRVEANARRGYISMAPELPVIANPTDNSEGEWVKKGYLHNAFKDTSEPLECSLFETVSAAVDAFNLLKSAEIILPEEVKIDKYNIGLTGFSWGGYLVTMLCGILKEQVKAGFSNYGCGYYDLTAYWDKDFAKMSEANKKIWLENYDAGRRAKNITAPFFIASPSNDTFFYPPSVMKTLESIPSDNKGLVFSPNSHHCIKLPGGTSENPDDPHGCSMENIYFDYHLKGEGDNFPKIILQGTTLTVDRNVVSVELIYSDNSVNYTEREWKKLNKDLIVYKNGAYTALIPEELKQNNDFYFLVTDDRNVSVSSEIFRITY